MKFTEQQITELKKEYAELKQLHTAEYAVHTMAKKYHCGISTIYKFAKPDPPRRYAKRVREPSENRDEKALATLAAKIKQAKRIYSQLQPGMSVRIAYKREVGRVKGLCLSEQLNIHEGTVDRVYPNFVRVVDGRRSQEISFSMILSGHVRVQTIKG